MNWVQFRDVTFNLDHVTHFDIGGDPRGSRTLRVYLNIGYPEVRGDSRSVKKEHQEYITVAKGTKQECKTWLKEIISGKYTCYPSDAVKLQKDEECVACTFCGWADPTDHFQFHTPGGVPVCDSCGLIGILETDEDSNPDLAGEGQGDGSYQSGRLRLIHRNGKTYYQESKN